MELTYDRRPNETSDLSADWKAIAVGNLGRWFSGGTPSKTNPAFWGGQIPWVSAKDMKVTRLHDSVDHVTNDAIGQGTRIVPTGSLLMVIRGMILAHSFPVARAERPLAFNQDLKALLTREGVDSEFVLYWLQNNAQLMLRLTTDSTHGTKRLPTQALFSTECMCPPYREQKAIAQVLRDVEVLLGALTRCIGQEA